jgi:small subunit ribosomal protein S16
VGGVFAGAPAVWQNRGLDHPLDPLSSAEILPSELPPGVHPTLQAIGSITFHTFRRIVAVKIRLKRLGKIRAPYYRIVVADSRTKRDGRVIEEIGKYHPTEEPSFIEVDSDRAQYWLSVGAQPTEQVLAILKLTGDWGRFKGDKDAVSTVKTREEKTAFEVDSSKKSVVKPKAEKKAEEPAEAPAAEATDAADEAADSAE